MEKRPKAQESLVMTPHPATHGSIVAAVSLGTFHMVEAVYESHTVIPPHEHVRSGWTLTLAGVYAERFRRERHVAVAGSALATAAGVFAVLAPVALAAASIVFVLAVWMTRFISVGSMAAAVTLPVVSAAMDSPGVVTAVATAAAAMIVHRHRGNAARLRAGTERFVLISTDKAVEPKTVMGASKALAERVVESRGATGATRFAAVRFGNVLGSSGSVLPIFRRQIAQGGPITVTHPDMTRFFMTIPEAVQLVIAATGIAEGGDIFVLDMGEPVSIMQLARDMIELSGLRPGVDIAIETVWRRPGEKLHEELFNEAESSIPTSHAKILVARVPMVAAEYLLGPVEDLLAAARARDDERMFRILKEMLPGFEPPASQRLPVGRVQLA